MQIALRLFTWAPFEKPVYFFITDPSVTSWSFVYIGVFPRCEYDLSSAASISSRTDSSRSSWHGELFWIFSKNHEYPVGGHEWRIQRTYSGSSPFIETVFIFIMYLFLNKDSMIFKYISPWTINWLTITRLELILPFPWGVVKLLELMIH